MAVSEFNLNWLALNIKTEYDAVIFFQTHNIIRKSKLCSNKHKMKIKCDRKYVYWNCQRKPCKNVRISVRKDTWLEGSKLELKQILQFIFSWTFEYTSCKFGKQELHVSNATTITFNNYLREVSNKLCVALLYYIRLINNNSLLG